MTLAAICRRSGLHHFLALSVEATDCFFFLGPGMGFAKTLAPQAPKGFGIFLAFYWKSDQIFE
jgi:hypothetical protein